VRLNLPQSGLWLRLLSQLWYDAHASDLE
jgi:hypothetical protein